MADFLSNNLPLVALFLASGAMLVWPEIAKLMGAGGTEVGTLEATRLLNQPTSLVLDVGDEKDFREGHLPRARHIPVGELGARLKELEKFKARPVLVTARGATRAGAACRFLKKSGFANVYQLKGGLAAWQQASLPLEK